MQTCYQLLCKQLLTSLLFATPKTVFSCRGHSYYDSMIICACIQIFIRGDIFRYTCMVVNLVLRLCLSRAEKWLFQMYYQQYTSRNENLEYSYANSDALSNEPVHEISNNVVCATSIRAV